MEIGDRVAFNSVKGTFYGTIVGEYVPKCRCKGKSKWVINFDDMSENKRVDKNTRLLEKVEGFEITESIPNFDFK